VRLFEELLPRHLMLIYQINNQVLGEITRLYPGNIVRMRNMSIIEEGPEKSLRMAQLCLHGSHTVNGVAELHSTSSKSGSFRISMRCGRKCFKTRPTASHPGSG
jgi:starch phosphorylase